MMLGIMLLTLGMLIFLGAVYFLYGNEGIVAFSLFFAIVGFVVAVLVVLSGGVNP